MPHTGYVRSITHTTEKERGSVVCPHADVYFQMSFKLLLTLCVGSDPARESSHRASEIGLVAIIPGWWCERGRGPSRDVCRKAFTPTHSNFWRVLKNSMAPSPVMSPSPNLLPVVYPM